MRALTEEQRQAIERRRGSLALTAGAGSGKTSVLVERFARAVHEDGVAPGAILAITFTERAAGELRERIRARLLGLGRRDGAREAQAAFIGTFHGFCARLLRAHSLAAGLDPAFRVMEEGLADRLRGLAFRDALVGFLAGERPDAVDLVAAYGAAPLERIVRNAHGALRSQGESRPRLALHTPVEPANGGTPPDGSAASDEQAERACALIDELMGRFDDAYGARKRRRSSVDFDDLELLARDLLRDRPEIRRGWADRFAMLMVDEFQDTNPRQLELLELLDRDNLFTVGDELQSIYGFRHADVTLFGERRDRLAGRGAALALTRNFRGRAPILAAVDRAFEARLGEAYTPLTPAREDGGLEEPVVELLLTDCRGWPLSGSGGLAKLPDATPWRIAEARLLAARIASLLDGGPAAPGEVAVLLRGLGDLPLYEAALQAVGVPTVATTGDFWGHRQVGDLLAYLRTLANPLDELALYSTLASPLVGVSSDGLVALARVTRTRGCSAWQAIERHGEEVELRLPPADREPVRSFRHWFSAERRDAPLVSLPELLLHAVEASGYDRHVVALPWGRRRMANIRKLVRLAGGYEAGEGRDLRGFLDHATHLSEAFGGREADAPAEGGRAEAVQLMSVHAAKGLEFPVVCVADLGRTPRLTAPDLIAEREGRVGLRLRTLGEPDARAALRHQELSEESQTAQQAEEDRILYVAMTRARDRLLLSGAADFARWPSPRRGCPPIAWLAPALVGDVSTLAAQGSQAIREVGGGLSVRCLLNVAASPALPSPALSATALPATTALVELEEAWPTARRGTGGSQAPATGALTGPLSDPDATISYSSLAELERCGYRHYLERVLGLPERTDATAPRGGGSVLGGNRPGESGPGEGGPGERGAGKGGGGSVPGQRGLDPRLRGAVVHLLLEHIDFARPEAPSGERVAEVARAAGVRLGRGERAEIAALLARALRAAPVRRLSSKTRRERPFAFSLGAGEPLVTGVLDLVAHEPDGTTLVVDYKSDRVTAEEDLERLVRAEYGLQRLLYGLAAIEQGAMRVEVAHWFLERPEETVGAVFLAEERMELRARLLTRIDELRARGFAVAEEPHGALCLTCPGRAGLCSWPEGQTLRDRPRAPASGERVATLTP
jgi:ATP-dependent exoDNAse (exonuclease V) beta subunit